MTIWLSRPTISGIGCLLLLALAAGVLFASPAVAEVPPGICASWSAPGPEPEVPQDTAVPTLILAGQFDPNITPEQSRRVADRIGPRARWILFAGTGHSVRHFNTCAQTLVAAFIAQPGQLWIGVEKGL